MKKLRNSMQAATTKTGYTIFTSILVVIFSTVVFLDAAKTEVVVAADGDVETIKTNTDTVGDLLDDLGIDVGQFDELSHEEGTEIVDGMEIRFESAHKVLLTIDGETEEYHTTAITAGQFFDEEAIDFSRYDDISHSNIAILNDNIEIEVTKALPVVINDGGDKEEIWTTEDTVKDLLEDVEVDFDKNDHVKPALDKEVKEDMTINVTHVETEQKEVTKAINHSVKKKKDNSLAKGKEKTVSKGQDGKKVITYKITHENGEEVNREVVGEEVVEDSTDKVVAIGTKEAPKAATKTKRASNNSNSSSNSDSSSKSSPSSSSGKTMTMEATAYGPDCTGCSGISATGMDLRGGGNVVAVDPSVIPLGSRVWVEGYGEAVAADTGGAINGNRIDVLYPSESAAHSWGRRTVQVKVLD